MISSVEGPFTANIKTSQSGKNKVRRRENQLVTMLISLHLFVDCYHCKRIVSKTQVSVSYAVSNFFSLTELLTESESCLSWKEWGVFSQFLLTVSKI